MKPWVSTVLYGAAPLPAIEINSEDWNQPRCWSLPSRYMSACQGGTGILPVSCFKCAAVDRLEACPTSCSNSLCLIRTERDEEPESIQTSSVSFDLETGSAPPFQFLGLTKPHNSAQDFSNQMFEPCFPMRSATLRTTAAAVRPSFDGSGSGHPCAS